MNEFWPKFQTYVGKCIPCEIIQILIQNGYDNTLAMREITDDEISIIERAVGKKYEPVLETSRYYSEWNSSEPFMFLPGHRKLIKELGKEVAKFMAYVDTREKADIHFPDAPSILKEMIKSLKQNKNVSKSHRRYSEALQWFSAYIFILSGKAAYEILCSNLPMPQAPTVLDYIQKRKQHINEGEIRAEKLSEYLENLNVPKKVWLSEDATGIVSKVSYDAATNQLIGLVLPTDDKTGMPTPFTFTPQSAKEINDQIKGNPLSNLVYLVLAQPVSSNAPPFILLIFGTDNTFKSQDVLSRWRHIRDQLSRYGIEVVGISSDGDARLLTSMKHSVNAMMNQPSHDIMENLCREQSITFVQDCVHLAVKNRNRLLKNSILLPIGSKQVSVSHLKMLIRSVPKAVHGIVPNDICPFDRQNFATFQKVSDERVLNALETNVPDSEATVIYLRMTRMAVGAFTEDKLEPLVRVLHIFRALYFFRAWKKWLDTYDAEGGGQSTTYNSDEENFISRNAFGCLELNAYSLLHLIKKFRDSKQENLFRPTLCNSQGCEYIFRRFRSMSTANWTKINFTLGELLHMVGRVELQNDIAHFKLPDDVKLPRVRNQHEEHKIFELPTDDQIRRVLGEALETALRDVAKFGINIMPEAIRTCELRKSNLPVKRKPKNMQAEYEDFNDTMDCAHFRDFSSEVSDFDGNSQFVQVFDDDGAAKLIKKSAVVWLVSDVRERLSTDRLKRVQARREDESNGPKRRREEQQVSNVKKIRVQHCFQKLDQIQVGEWCIFRRFIDESHNHFENGTHSDIVLGAVLGFKYITGKTEKEKQYGLDAAPVSSEFGKRGIEVLALWYELNNDFTLTPLQKPSFFINIDNYLGFTISPETIQNPVTKEKSYKIPGNVDYLKNALTELLSQ